MSTPAYISRHLHTSERELSLIEARLHHLVEHIANGNGNAFVTASLHKEEARRKAVAEELSRLDNLTQVVSLDAKRLAKDLRSRLEKSPCPVLTACTPGPPDAQEAPGWAYRL
jgi:hypothetical protein